LAAQIGFAVAERKAAANDRPTMLVDLTTNWRHKRRRFGDSIVFAPNWWEVWLKKRTIEND
jgi:hypothetical protein